MKNTRIKEIDIIKGLAIIFMVAGHASAPFAKFTGMFHMAVFFMASAYFYRDIYSDSIKNIIEFIKKRIIQLWKPFFIWNTVFVLLHNMFCNIGIYTNNKNILEFVADDDFKLIGSYSVKECALNIIKGAAFGRSEQFSSVLWFVKILFCISCIYVVVDFMLKKIKISNKIGQLVVSTVFLMVGYFLSIRRITAGGLGQIFSFYILYYLGVVIAGLKDKTDKLDDLKWCAVIIITFGMILLSCRMGSISLAKNRYENPAFLLATSILGWFFLYGIAHFLAKTGASEIICLIGQNTMEVLLFHLLSFKLVILLIIKLYNLPRFVLAAYPNLYGNMGLWWLLYTLVGTLLPVVVKLAYNKMIKKA